MNKDIRILIDMDSVICDFIDPWYGLHNAEYGHIHKMVKSEVYTWNTAQICKDHNCPADIYGYFNNPKVWTDGIVISNSVDITKQWLTVGYELGVITTASNAMSLTHKQEWLDKYFPHIRNVMMVNGHIKHWVMGDFLIDDAIHNHDGFEGISVLYDGAWNQGTDLPRARDWNHVEKIIARGVSLLCSSTFAYMKSNPHKVIQALLYDEIKAGKL